MQLEKISLNNSKGTTLEVLNYGATLLSLKVPNSKDKFTNVIVGLSKIEDYLNEKKFFLGKSIGRYAGRISNGGFTLDNKFYPIYNENGIHLHGGKEGFSNKYWTIEKIVSGQNPSVELSYLSKHLEEGYPGNLKVSVKYEISEKDMLKIKYTAITDKKTFINLTNHSYFNLDGAGSILNHQLTISSNSYFDMNKHLLPTGRLNMTKNTHLDFSNKVIIGRKTFKGIDNSFVLKDTKLKASLYSNKTGIKMDVYTNQPAMVVYTPKDFSILSFQEGACYTSFPAICLETQNFPDAPNSAYYTNSILEKNQIYINESMYDFSIDR